MKRIHSLLLVAILVTSSANAQKTAREEIAANPFLAGSNYLNYDNYPATKPLTPSPAGYEPFYMSHYGRHGSRWLIGKGEYSSPLSIFRKAHEQGKLTPQGIEVMEVLAAFYPTSVNRLGDLTTVGERQHHGIGRRLVEHFPEIFKHPGVAIDARSTVVIRCILSMTAECEEFAAANPTARIHNDVSEAFQYYLNQDWSERLRKASRKGEEARRAFRNKLTKPERFAASLFNDPAWVRDSINAGSLMRSIFSIATNMQSHDTELDLLHIFTFDELYDLWRAKNVEWYTNYGPAPVTDGIMPFSQLNLLKNILATADTVTQVQATLRFGHEVCVMPLAALLELGPCAARVENLDELDAVWRNYNIYPMAGNVQLIFYRPTGGKPGDILVKALLNEREVSMPVKTTHYPYYRWADLRAYYQKKIEDFEAGE